MAQIADDREREYFELAFGLAYFLHVDRDLASIIAEDAVAALPTTLTLQDRNRRSSGGLRGVLKWGERSRPVRRTAKLTERQTLQWLVYKQSQDWERETESGEGFYQPTDEDLVVRYIEHLVYITQRRGSFNVTLAVGSLLHQFNRRETRLFYDILTQCDSARMKDTSYIGKKRLELMEKISRRFGHMLRMINSPPDETRFVTRQTEPRLIEIVRQCLRRFTPWDTTCVVKHGFDITDIPGLYFSGPDIQDEEQVEINRISTVLDPECFHNFIDGLSKYVASLPAVDQDKTCDFDSPDERLAVPLFSKIPDGPARGDRSRPPDLTRADYVRLRRTLEARANRRKEFKPTSLRVFVNSSQGYELDLNAARRLSIPVSAEAWIVEVRGADEDGEVTLATLLLDDEQTRNRTLALSIVHEGGQRLTITLFPSRPGGEASAQLEVRYAAAGQVGSFNELLAMARRISKVVVSASTRSWHQRWAMALAACLFITAGASLLWRLFVIPPERRQAGPADQVNQRRGDQTQTVGQAGDDQSSANVSPSPQLTRQVARAVAREPLARAAWNTSPEGALRAVPVETMRDENRTREVSGRVARVYLSVPRYDDVDQPYSSYRVSLYASGRRLWQQTLQAPGTVGKNSYLVMTLTLSPLRLPRSADYDLCVEAFGPSAWSQLGHVHLSRKTP